MADYEVTRGWDDVAADMPALGSADPLAEAHDIARELSLADGSRGYQVVEILPSGTRRGVADWYRGTRQEG